MAHGVVGYRTLIRCLTLRAVLAFGSVKKVTARFRGGDLARQLPLNRVNRVLCHCSIHGPLSTKNADQTARWFNLDFIVADHLFRVARIPGSDQWPQACRSADYVVQVEWCSKASIDMTKQKLGL